MKVDKVDTPPRRAKWTNVDKGQTPSLTTNAATRQAASSESAGRQWE